MDLPKQDCVGPWCPVFLNLVRPPIWIVGVCEPIRTVPLSPEVFPLTVHAGEHGARSGAELRTLFGQ